MAGQEHAAVDATPLATRLVGAVGLEPDDLALPPAELEAALLERIRSAKNDTPGVQVSDVRVIDHLATCIAHHASVSTALEAIPFADLRLACACIHGDHAAIESLNALVADVAVAAVRGIGLDGAAIDDLAQEFRARLLVGTPTSPPLLERYNGLASLRSWLRLMMARRALKLKRKSDREQPFERGVMQALVLDYIDPELSYLKTHYAEEFRGAFKRALLELDAGERNTLHFVLVEGLTVKDVAGFFGLNRVTVSRRLQGIRRRLLERTRWHLASTLKLGPEELDSIIQLIRSRLDITVSCLAEE